MTDLLCYGTEIRLAGQFFSIKLFCNACVHYEMDLVSDVKPDLRFSRKKVSNGDMFQTSELENRGRCLAREMCKEYLP